MEKDLSWFKSHDQGTYQDGTLSIIIKRYSMLIVTSIPELKDLYQHITPQYAADWEVIGTLLGLPSGELKAIEAGYPTNVKWCCNQMLKSGLRWTPLPLGGSCLLSLSHLQCPVVKQLIKVTLIV